MGSARRADCSWPISCELLVERGAEPVLYAGWEAIDEAERALGEPHGRPRIKLCTWDDLLTAARN
jgi:ferredoxin--NADP+ reductase